MYCNVKMFPNREGLKQSDSLLLPFAFITELKIKQIQENRGLILMY